MRAPRGTTATRDRRVGGFTLDGAQGAARVTLRWNVSYVAADAATSVNVLALLGSTADTMTERLNNEFRAT